MIEFKGIHFERDVILWAVRWYVAYPISYRQLEEMMEEHGVEADHATLNRMSAQEICDRTEIAPTSISSLVFESLTSPSSKPARPAPRFLLGSAPRS
jgi:hypothetical protein